MKHPNVASRLNDTATMYYFEGRCTDAEELSARASRLFEHLHANHPATVRIRPILRAYAMSSAEGLAETSLFEFSVLEGSR